MTLTREQEQSLVEQFEPLVQMLVRRLKMPPQHMDDAMQEGRIGALRAVRRFDPARGVKLITFVQPTVYGHLLRFIRDFAYSPLKLPRKNGFDGKDKQPAPIVESLDEVISVAENGSKITIVDTIATIEHGYESFEILHDLALALPRALKRNKESRMMARLLSGESIKDIAADCHTSNQRVRNVWGRLRPRVAACMEGYG